MGSGRAVLLIGPRWLTHPLIPQDAESAGSARPGGAFLTARPTSAQRPSSAQPLRPASARPFSAQPRPSSTQRRPVSAQPRPASALLTGSLRPAAASLGHTSAGHTSLTKMYSGQMASQNAVLTATRHPDPHAWSGTGGRPSSARPSTARPLSAGATLLQPVRPESAFSATAAALRGMPTSAMLSVPIKNSVAEQPVYNEQGTGGGIAVHEYCLLL